MIFLTVGTQFPFERLIKAMDEAVALRGVGEEIFAQIGDSAYLPRNFEFAPRLKKHIFDKRIRQASSLIGHAGIGTIITALDNNKPLLVMPRRKKYHEVVNDHQVAVAKKFEKRGYILAVYAEPELPGKIAQLRTFVPWQCSIRPQKAVEIIRQYLNQLVDCSGKR